VVSLFLRRIFLMCCAGGGVWLAFGVVDMLAQQAGGGGEFHLTREGSALLIPVGLAGAMFGAFVGGLFFPARR
jgi:hypothetical protein